MIRRLVEEKHYHIAKRLVAILTAVVFALGIIYMPTGVYGVETDTTDDSVVTNAIETMDETVAPEAEAAAAEEEGVAPETDVDTVAEETPGTEDEEPVAESEVASTEAAVGELNDALTVNLDSVDEKEYDGFIYKLEDDVTKKEVKEMESAIDDLDESEGQKVEEVIKEELYTADSIETIAEVAEPAMIEYIEPDYIVRATETNDEYYNEYGWHLEMIHAPYVWSRGMFGSGVTVAVLDSGVYTAHEDFKENTFTKQYNVLDKTNDVTDNYGHGTAVAGMIASAYNNEKGLTGVMAEVKIMPVKVLYDDGRSNCSNIIDGINYAANHGASVINLSLGTTGKSSSLETACKAAASRGVILVASSGNEAEEVVGGVLNPVEYPAAFDTVISVGSVDKNGVRSYFSTYNNKLTVTAPGQHVFLPAIPQTGYKYKTDSGTSFACPQVAAMAAMMKQMDPSVNCDGFRKIISVTSTDKGTPGFDPYYGYGIMDLAKAYRYMAGDISMYEASLSSTTYVYNGKIKTPRVTVYKANKALSAGYYRTTYASGRKKVGSYRVIVEGVNGYTGTRVLSFNIVPPLVKKIKAPKRGKKKLTVRWKAMSKKQKKKYKNAITGYQVRVSTSKQFTKAKYAKVKGISKTQKTVKGLKKKKTYYVQYRSYKTVGSKTYYSKWSSTKKAKTK